MERVLVVHSHPVHVIDIEVTPSHVSQVDLNTHLVCPSVGY